MPYPEPPPTPDPATGDQDAEVPWARRVVRAEVNRRRVNEALERGSDTTGGTAFICECGRIGCNTTLELDESDYEAVRTSFERFFVVPGHEIEGVDRIVEDHGEYFVVAKHGDAAEIARVEDPRAASE